LSCCHAQTGRGPQRSWWRSAGGGVSSGTLLVLLPKCPMCIAAYIALWTGAGVPLPIAMRLRPLLQIVFVISAALCFVQCVVMRTRREVELRETRK
jgi:hypothetical protein